MAKCPMNVFDIEDSGTSFSSTSSLHEAAILILTGVALQARRTSRTSETAPCAGSASEKTVGTRGSNCSGSRTTSSVPPPPPPLSLQPSMARATNPAFPPVPHTISLDRIDGNPSAQRALRGGRKGLHGQVPHRPHRTRQPPRPVKDPLRHSNHKNKHKLLQIIFPPFSFFPILKSDKNRTALFGPFR